MCICTVCIKRVADVSAIQKTQDLRMPVKGEGIQANGHTHERYRKDQSFIRTNSRALKLCDMDGLTQEEAGLKMGISRGTVQRILSSARKKVATALSGCMALVMEEIICKEEKLS